jgi:prepilin-type N-terminal cleavage/methylation domain-containing protein
MKLRPNRRQIPATRTGFTLVELLVVIGIIAMLMSILLPTLRRVRMSAQQIRSSAEMRELMSAYTRYHIDHSGALLMAYPPDALRGQPVTVDDPISGKTYAPYIGTRWPWRLKPWCPELWGIIHSHHDMPALPAPDDEQLVAEDKAAMLSVDVSYGINSAYVGGHRGSTYRGYTGTMFDGWPDFDRHSVYRANEVRRPSMLIVFAESQAFGTMSGMHNRGLHFVTPPLANGRRWRAEGGAVVRMDFTSMSIGLPIGRHGRTTLVACFDGHVEAMRAAELEDMRRWSHAARAADHDPIASP